MNDLLSSGGRYHVKMARGEGAHVHGEVQTVLNDCPKGFHLHSVVPWASGGGYTLQFLVVFERDHGGKK